MTTLLDHLCRRIAQDGPLTIAQYMEECLANPKHGYYMGRDPFGRGGDFITAPEVSQMFGELVGLWCGIEWLALGQPDSVHLVELGPGRGTLMADILRVAKGVKGFSEAIRLHLVETSPVLRDHQRRQLSDYNPTWHNHLTDVPEGATLIVANEFFDALPIRQFQRIPDGWCERLVGMDENADGQKLRVGWAAPQLVHPLVPKPFAHADVDSVVEISPVSLSYMRILAERLIEGRGAALVIDYGPARSGVGESFQAVKNHQFTDVLAEPGEVDLTAHVDFEALVNVAVECGAQAFGPLTQGAFLKILGIEERADRLATGATAEQAGQIKSDLKRLIGAEEMGDLFKVIAVTCPDLDPPVGFQEGEG
jgi:NADH dehydrogenase [ubiquinone] 1 alpha subcomplex assembly factor 7